MTPLRPSTVLTRRSALAIAAALCLTVGGGALIGVHVTQACHPAAGGRCAEDLPIKGQTVSSDGQPTDGLTVSADGRTLAGVFVCGGRLRDHETASVVTVTYRASAVGPGGMTCALVPVSVHLHRPLDGRVVVDGTDGATVPITAQPTG